MAMVIDPVRAVVGGFAFTEGPVWHPRELHLIFSDIPGNRTYRWADGFLSVERESSNKTNGNTYDRQGRLVSCEHLTSSVVREELDGQRTVLADRYRGSELNSPNDVIVDTQGRLYFTDPVFGRTEEAMGKLRTIPQPVRGVYRLANDGAELELIVADCEAPNGLCLSLDERYLFVNDTTFDVIRRFDVGENAVTGGEVWAHPAGDGRGAVDGMKIDSEGNLFCTGPGGVFVYSPDATLLAVIEVPEAVGNFTWGDADLSTLYLCASTTVYSARVSVPGLALF